MTTARRHHYLPQTYLAGFTNTGRKDGRLRVLDVQTGRTFPTTPINVGTERDFNIIDDEDKPPGGERSMVKLDIAAVRRSRRKVEVVADWISYSSGRRR